MQSITRGTAANPVDIAETAETLTISTGREVPIFVDWGDLFQSPWTKRAEIVKRSVQRLNEFTETDVLDDHANWRNIGGSAGNWTDNVATTLAVSAANVDDLIRLVRQVIRAQNGQDLAAENGIFHVWDPASFNFLEALDRRGLLKPSLIKAKVQQWITHTKQAIALQVKRLSEKEPIIGYATV